MIKMRLFEEKVATKYPEAKMKTPVHLGIGQEAIAAGVLSNKTKDDVVFSHHRCHNHYIGCGGDLKPLAAELYGKKDGVSGGRGGSVHLTDRLNGFMASTAIMGESIAMAVGGALGLKQQKLPGISIVFFGDGALDEGAAWESVNFAAIHKLPVLFVCENNFYSAESVIGLRNSVGRNYIDRFKAFGIPAELVDGNDVIAVQSISARMINSIRNLSAPYFLECETYRWKEHVGPNEDEFKDRSYRTPDELNLWKEKCPIVKFEKVLVESNPDVPQKIAEIRKLIEEEVEASFLFAEASDFPELGRLGQNIFLEATIEQ